MALEIVVNGGKDWSLPEGLLARGVEAVFSAEGIDEGEISLTFLDDDAIAALNDEYLGRPGPTDVLAFALHDGGESVLGDVYVGYEQARRQARDLDVPLEEELLRLAVHGALHVLGHDHPEGVAREESEMYRRQEEILARVLSDPGG